MNITEIDDLIIIAEDGRLMTDSIKIAKKFGKRHDRVLRAYDNLGCSEEFNRTNFGEIEYVDTKGRSQRAIAMTKDGYSILAMGFTGPEAMKFKEEYIARFNNMQSTLAAQQGGLWLQMQALIAREIESQVRASFGSRLMLNRKKEIPPLKTERELLEQAIQPSLLN